ncbi:ATP-dependent DNA helicase DDX11 isoform X2 [Orussus abietinus]|uniref:ATP-dependent DNA helicase DDX11 isoform X2 n=1 Tax=Orussus abietinus TaxID=222816 RepID=UPI000626D87E|nr:ATP-dependent DNA helicase DDX11 isoform X2 [Orussus abietinus]
MMDPPEDFPFPFSPYNIQKEFMRNLYMCLENGHLGIFESPTGTGKSLSLICGAVRWLLDHEERQKNELEEKIRELDIKLKEAANKVTDDWFSVQTGQLQVNAEKQEIQRKLDAIYKNEEKIKKYKARSMAESKKSKRKFIALSKAPSASEDVKQIPSESDTKETSDDFAEELILDDAAILSDSSDEEDTDDAPFRCSKIFFCSRTHSQLSQFVGELRKSPYAEKVSLVPLASRNNYCINKDVKKLRNGNLINERCLQLQRKKTTTKQEKTLKRSKTLTSCPFMPGNQEFLIAQILTTIQDIEDITEVARLHKTCPYYASRNSTQDGQIVLVPYNSILHKNTRLSSGIDLKGNVLIIDEAHNLLDAIERMHSATVTGRNILHCYSQLSQYQKRFEAFFSAKNVLYLSQLSFCLKKFIKVLGGSVKSNPGDKIDENVSSKLYNIQEFETVAEIDTINIFELLLFVKNSKLPHKLQGYIEKYSSDLKTNDKKPEKSGILAYLDTLRIKSTALEEIPVNEEEKSEEDLTSNPLLLIISFLECLKSSSMDGRINFTPGATIGQSAFKYFLLNPAAHFQDIVTDARAVVLAGGTMEPISEFKEQLFISAGAKPERIVTFSCDHVVPKTNIHTSIVTRGPGGLEFEFNFQNRNNTKLLEELGRALLNLCNVIPAGIVVFLPSYNYEATVYKHLQDSGIISKILKKKRIFREPKQSSQLFFICCCTGKSRFGRV